MSMESQKSNSNSLVNYVADLLERRPVIYQFLRFASIGLMTTALNFLLLNAGSKALGISQGWKLGAVDLGSFAIAVVQSYVWHRTWTFGKETGVSLFTNVVRLLLVGLLGLGSMVMVLIAAHLGSSAFLYCGFIVAYFLLQYGLWRLFGFHKANWHHEGHSFPVFVTVTCIGLGINVLLVAVLSSHVHWTGGDLDKNIATILATGVSLFWNFIGYKLVVFKSAESLSQ